MRRLLSRLGTAFLRAVSAHGRTLAAVPDPHGQFNAVPIPWQIPGNDPADMAGPPSWHPDRTP